MKPLRGDIWNVQFDPSQGAEIKKVRPAAVMNDAHVGRLPLCIVVPITDWKPVFSQISWFVHLRASLVNGLTKDSVADTFQVNSVSKTRMLEKLGELPAADVDAIAAAIALCSGFRPE